MPSKQRVDAEICRCVAQLRALAAVDGARATLRSLVEDPACQPPHLFIEPLIAGAVPSLLDALDARGGLDAKVDAVRRQLEALVATHPRLRLQLGCVIEAMEASNGAEEALRTVGAALSQHPMADARITRLGRDLVAQ